MTNSQKSVLACVVMLVAFFWGMLVNTGTDTYRLGEEAKLITAACEATLPRNENCAIAAMPYKETP